MNIDDIITLDDGKRYYIFDIVKYEKVKYYFAVSLLQNDKVDTKDFKFFTFEVDNNEEYVNVVEDTETLLALYAIEVSNDALENSPDGEKLLTEFARKLEDMEVD